MLSILVLAAVSVLAISAALELARIAHAGRGLPMWDPAEHGLAGVTLAEALRRGDLVGFLLGLNRQVMWPFVHSLMLAPWVLVRGHDYPATDELSAALFAATVVTLGVAGLRLHPTRGAWVGAAAAALALTAPLYRFFGTVTMLEMPGAFLLALTAGLHVFACREPAPRALLVAAGVSTTALCLCKYNYGLLWLAPLALHEWLTLPEATRRAGWGRGVEFLRSRRWLRPFPLIVGVWMLAIAAIQVTGGGVVELLGARISVRSPGNAAYGLLVVLVAWGLGRTLRAGGRAAWGRLAGRHRILISTIVVPLVVWFLIPVPNRVRALVGFVVNRDSGLPPWSLDTLLFYPRAFATEYSPHPVVGWVVLALALVPPIRRAADRDPGRLLYLALWVGLLVTAIHPYRQPRFLFTTVPIVWLLAARRAVGLADRLLGSRPVPAWLREPAWATALVATLGAAWLAAPAADATLARRRAFNTPAAIGPALDRVLGHAERLEQPAWLLGQWNGLSPALVRWHRLLTRPTLAEGRLPEQPGWLPAGSSETEILARLDRLRRSGRPVIAALAERPFAGETAEYRMETWADRMTAARLAADPRVIREADELASDAAFRITTYRFAEASPAPNRGP